MNKGLKIFICSCHNSDKIARRILEKGGVPDWASYPVYRGKADSLKALETLSQMGYAVSTVQDYIREHSSFVIFLAIGDPNGHTHYADANGRLEQKLEAEAMVEWFVRK